MASVDQTLTELIRAFPCSYPDRTQALHHVLVVLGTGHEWRDGSLVQRFDSDGRNCLDVHGQFKLSAEQADHMREYGDEVPQELLDGTCPAEHLRPLAADLARTPGPLLEDPYPACTSAPLFTVPADADDDWVEAAREIAAVVLPLWAAPSAYELAIESSLTDTQRAYVTSQRTEALDLLERRFGPGFLTSTGR
ncbi:hypothetical protein [Streptacidiphilus jiangxiensis]|uniref:Uncharacterized protein n=1 Tax=Streptacidiphilus jiangxiensis TaxID=235985 RepID=A0A1H8BBX9_STRJI|nr:hypothetical protein [Streptacidiphilus jiangxiensis]SEM79614.1 hypothetical protein SAMN05414137_1604 [Streptacidiphilus jiangxiensis]